MVHDNPYEILSLFIIGIEFGSAFSIAIYYLIYRKHKANFQHFFAIFLLLIAIQILLECTFDLGMIEKNYDNLRINVMVCLHSVPVAIIMLASMYHPLMKKVKLYRYGLMLSSVLFLLTIIFLITWNTVWVYVALMYTVVIFAVCCGLLLSWKKEYYQYVENNYASADSMSFSWLKSIAILFALWIIAYLFLLFHPTYYWELLYDLFGIVVIFVLNHFVIKQHVIQEDSLIKDVEQTEEVLAETMDSQAIDNLLAKSVEKNRMYLHPELSIDDVAAEIGMNKRYLSFYLNNFKRTNFNMYINNLRLDYACHLLIRHPDMDLHDVYTLSGFNTLYTFNRVFHQRFGMGPKDYREKEKSGENASIVPVASVSQTDQKEFMEKLEGEEPLNGFIQLFNLKYPDYIQRLLAQDVKLSNKEQLLCMLLYVDIDSATIARTMDVTRESLRVAKSRLNSKLNPRREYESLGKFLKNM